MCTFTYEHFIFHQTYCRTLRASPSLLGIWFNCCCRTLFCVLCCMLKTGRVMQIDIPGREEYQPCSANPMMNPSGRRGGWQVKGALCLSYTRRWAVQRAKQQSVQISTCSYGGSTNETHLRADKSVRARSSAGERDAVRCDGDGWTVSCDSDEPLLLFRCQIWRSTIWSSSALSCRAFSSSFRSSLLAKQSLQILKRNKLQSKNLSPFFWLILIYVVCFETNDASLVLC